MHNLLFSEYFAQLSKYLCLYFNATESLIVDKKFQGTNVLFLAKFTTFKENFACVASWHF